MRGTGPRRPPERRPHMWQQGDQTMTATGIIRRTRGLAVVLALAAALVAGYLWQGQAGAAEQSAPKYGATELADAVLFNEGPAARHLGSLGRGEVPWNDTLREGQKAVHEAIERDPRWARS